MARRRSRAFERRRSSELYADFTFEFAARESGVDAATLERGRRARGRRRHAAVDAHLAQRRRRATSAAGRSSRTLFLLNALLGAVATEGGTFPNAWNKFVPGRSTSPPHPETWNELTWPRRVSARDERDVVPAAAPAEGRPRQARRLLHARLQPGVDEPGRLLVDRGAHRRDAGRPARRADADLERDRVTSPTTCCRWASAPSATTSTPTRQHDGQWIGFRQPVLRAARERAGRDASHDTREVNPGEVWEENEFWIELTWRIDPDGALGIRQYVESQRAARARSSASTSTTAGSSRTRFPGCRSARPPRA